MGLQAPEEQPSPAGLQGAHLSHQLLDNGHDAVILGEALVGHVPGRPLRTDEDIPAPGFEADVLHIRAHPAVGLAKHGLWPERRRHQEDVFTSQATGEEKVFYKSPK